MTSPATLFPACTASRISFSVKALSLYYSILVASIKHIFAKKPPTKLSPAALESNKLVKTD